jgi:NADH-quinone oxidoreductase subunit G
VLESEFSGNLTEVCPTGVFTDKTHSARYNRKWDMQFAPSICQHCAVGCNISPGERYGELRRVENRYNGAVNHYFLCDRGRFGYGHVNSAERPRTPLLRQGDALVSATIDTALTTAGEALRHVRRIIGIGSPRASVEANFALRELVGADNFSVGMPLPIRSGVSCARSSTCSAARRPKFRRCARWKSAMRCSFLARMSPRPRRASRWHCVSPRRARRGKWLAAIESWRLAGSGRAEYRPARHFRLLFITSFSGDPSRRYRRPATTAPPRWMIWPASVCRRALHRQRMRTGESKCGCRRRRQLAASHCRSLLAADNPLVVAGTGTGSHLAAVIQAAANIVPCPQVRGKTPSNQPRTVPEVNSLGVSLVGGNSRRRRAVGTASKVGSKPMRVVILENDLYRQADATLSSMLP